MLPPYIALDFDRNVLKCQQGVTGKIGELQSIEHLATYGRPMYVVLIRLWSIWLITY